MDGCRKRSDDQIDIIISRASDIHTCAIHIATIIIQTKCGDVTDTLFRVRSNSSNMLDKIENSPSISN